MYPDDIIRLYLTQDFIGQLDITVKRESASTTSHFLEFSATLNFFISLHQYVLPAASDSHFQCILFHLGCENIRFPQTWRKFTLCILLTVQF